MPSRSLAKYLFRVQQFLHDGIRQVLELVLEPSSIKLTRTFCVMIVQVAGLLPLHIQPDRAVLIIYSRHIQEPAQLYYQRWVKVTCWGCFNACRRHAFGTGTFGERVHWPGGDRYGLHAAAVDVKSGGVA